MRVWLARVLLGAAAGCWLLSVMGGSAGYRLQAGVLYPKPHLTSPSTEPLPCSPKPPAPSSTRPQTGHFNLIYTPPASRRQGFELLSASEKGAHMHLVKQRRVAAMSLEPQSTGGWVC